MKYGDSAPMVEAPTHEQQLTLATLDSRIRSIEDFLRRRDVQTANAQREWQRSLSSGNPLYWAPSRGLRSKFSFETDHDATSQDGIVTFAPGRIGRAASFDGKVYLDSGSAADFDIDDQFTLAAWVYSDASPDGSVMSRM